MIDPRMPHSTPCKEATVSTDLTVEALRPMHISIPSIVPPTPVGLDMPLDEPVHSRRSTATGLAVHHEPLGVYTRDQEPSRRDSMKRREALLKGEEGSRRRQRWENDHLLGNPHARPPLPSDWEVRPTYPRHGTLPYNLAQLWDDRMSHQVAVRQRRRGPTDGDFTASEDAKAKAKAARDVRQRMRKARAARGFLRDLEEEIRAFVRDWVEAQQVGSHKFEPDVDSDDEDIVFVGRNGQMSDDADVEPREISPEKLILQTSADDNDGAFRRWLVHCVATYYGLHTYSITVGDPARREAYVSLLSSSLSSSLGVCGTSQLRRAATTNTITTTNAIPHELNFLPQPLWGLV